MCESIVIIAANPQDALVQLQSLVDEAERMKRREARWQRYLDRKKQREIEDGRAFIKRYFFLDGISTDINLN